MELELQFKANLELATEPSFRNHSLIEDAVDSQPILIQEVEDIGKDRYHRLFNGDIFLHMDIECPVGFISLVVSLARRVSGSESGLRFPVAANEWTVGVKLS